MSDRAYVSNLADDSGTFEGQFQRAWSNTMMELTILPTEYCNFRCTYCYEDFKIGRMGKDVVQGIKSLVERRAPELKHLHITWFGGEPLIAYGVVTELSQHFRDVCQHFRIKYTSHMTTNGSLLAIDRFRQLVDLGVNHFQVSIDGSKSHHNRTRLSLNGGETYDVIFENLRAIRASSVPGEIMLRLHITHENQSDLEEFVRQIARDFLDDPRFSLFFVPIGRLGGPQDSKIKLLEPQMVNNLISNLIGVVRKQQGGSQSIAASDQYSDVKQGDRVPDSRQGGKMLDVCYAARPNALVIRADGRIAKCTVALNAESNCIGKIRGDGLLEIDNGKHGTWLKGWFDGSEKYLKCPAGIF